MERFCFLIIAFFIYLFKFNRFLLRPNIDH
jgi:hypothetical protein